MCAHRIGSDLFSISETNYSACSNISHSLRSPPESFCDPLVQDNHHASWGSTVGGLDALNCEQARREKAEARACANFWRKHAEKEGKTFTQAMQAAKERSGRIIHLFCKGHMRQQKKSSARMGFLQWSSAANVLKMHRWNKDRDASLSAQYRQQLLAWHMTSWNSVSIRANAARVYAVHEFTALKARLKLVSVLRALKAQVLQIGHEKRVTAALERNTRLVQFRMASISKRAICNSFLAWALLHYIAAKASKIIARLMHQTSAMCFIAWCKHTDEELRKQLLMKRIMLRTSGDLMSGGFGRLHENNKERTRERKVMIRIISRSKKLSLSVALERWADQTVALKAAEKRKKLIMQCIIQRMLNAKISTAIQMWHAHIVAKKIMASRALKTIARWVNQCVASTLGAWHGYTVEEKRKRNLMARIVQRLQRRGIVWALDLWHSNVVLVMQEREEHDRRNHVTHKIIVHIMNSLMSRSSVCLYVCACVSIYVFVWRFGSPSFSCGSYCPCPGVVKVVVGLSGGLIMVEMH